MNTVLARIGAVTVVTAVLIGLAGSAYAAEKKRFKWAHTARQTVSETKTTPYPDYELTQGVYSDVVKGPADFDIVEERVFDQSETVSGNGRHRGTAIDTFKSGDTATQRYDGTHKVVVKAGGAWEVVYEGTFEYISGTGKYKNIKGQGTYRGRMTPDGIAEEDEAEVTY